MPEVCPAITNHLQVCIPLWCSSSDSPQKAKSITQPHHRVVRIPPGESVVLNSAERAPYLLLVEILNDDLDFDPGKRSNKEVLKKIVTKEDERKGASRDLIPFSNITVPHRHRVKSDAIRSTDTLPDNESVQGHNLPVVVIPATPVDDAGSFAYGEEEIDLVEQLYGADHTLRSHPIDLSESIVLPPAPKNKELDMVAWSRSSSVAHSPVHGQISNIVPFSSPVTPSSPSVLRHGQKSPPIANGHGRVLSLDEYSQRMRTAAVMLAQLNANIVRESVVSTGMASYASDSPIASSTSWKIGSNWLAGSPVQPNTRGPVHPSLVGGMNDSLAGSSGRIKVQHSEATVIRDRIMKEMLSLEEERMKRMRESKEGEDMMRIGDISGSVKTAEDEGIIRRELTKADPSALVFSESWATKKVSHFPTVSLLANCEAG